MTDTLAPTRLFPFENSYVQLPERFYVRLPPTPVAKPRLVRLNEGLARELGLDPERLATEEGVAVLVGNKIAEGSDPIAQAYAGHQFGGFSPQLGDGRAILLGEVIDTHGQRRDIQLKGSGPTPFSRRGDGRAAIGPVLREMIISEAMFALGIPTTRSLAAVLTGEPVFRETALPGAVLTRVAASHIRVGTFQYFAARNDTAAVQALADHVIIRHYPEIGDAGDRYTALLEAVLQRQTRLVARWLLVGFIHGVMNTDNTSIAGETIDYGPCAFMDAHDPATVYSSIDQNGRYAFGNQPRIMQWNLARFAETLLPLMAPDEAAAIEKAQAAISRFTGHFEAAYLAGLREKLGIFEAREDDFQLIRELLEAMVAGKADHTLTFRRLADAAMGPGGDAGVRALFETPDAYDAWAVRWRQRLASEGGDGAERRARMRRVSPAYIPRNHLVEEALAAATNDNPAPFERLMAILARPFDDQPGAERYALPPRPEEVVRHTFCGT